MDTIESKVKSYVLSEFLPGADAAELTPTTPLITGGVLDSVATFRLVAYLEDQFKISVASHEANVNYLDTIEQIVALVKKKQGK
jgi:acyl carrier protein